MADQIVPDNYQVHCAVTTVASVTSGGTYKYFIVGSCHDLSGDEDSVTFTYGSFSTLFTPSPWNF